MTEATTNRLPILAALQEHRRLRVITQHLEDEHPESVRMYAIEDQHLSGATPQNLAEAAGLLRFALLRSIPDIGADAGLRGERDPARADFDMFYGEAWASLLCLEQLIERDAEIDAAFGVWGDCILASRQREMTEEEVTDCVEAEVSAGEALSAIPAKTPRALAIKTYVGIHATDGSTRFQPFLPRVERDGYDEGSVHRQALVADLAANWPELAEWVETFLHQGGRLLIDPRGKMQATSDLSAFFDAETDEKARAALKVLGDLRVAYGQLAFRMDVKRLVLARGVAQSGWIVLERSA